MPIIVKKLRIFGQTSCLHALDMLTQSQSARLTLFQRAPDAKPKKVDIA